MFEELKQSRALNMAQHFLFRNPSVYLPLYLRYGDKADFLRPPFSPLAGAAADAGRADRRLAEKAHRANVPFILGFVPQEAQVC